MDNGKKLGLIVSVIVHALVFSLPLPFGGNAGTEIIRLVKAKLIPLSGSSAPSAKKDGRQLPEITMPPPIIPEDGSAPMEISTDSGDKEDAKKQLDVYSPPADELTIAVRSPSFPEPVGPAEGSPGPEFTRRAKKEVLTPSSACDTPEPGEKASALLEDQLKVIRERIVAARRYPPVARKKGWQGRAEVRFRIDGEGKPVSVNLIRSSGFHSLDRASMEAVGEAAPYPPLRGWVTVPIVFRLEG